MQGEQNKRENISKQQSVYTHNNISFCDEYNPFADEDQECVASTQNEQEISISEEKLGILNNLTEATEDMNFDQPYDYFSSIQEPVNETTFDQTTNDISLEELPNHIIEEQKTTNDFNLIQPTNHIATDHVINETQQDFWTDESDLINEFERININEKHVTFSEEVETILVDKFSKKISEDNFNHPIKTPSIDILEQNSSLNIQPKENLNINLDNINVLHNEKIQINPEIIKIPEKINIPGIKEIFKQPKNLINDSGRNNVSVNELGYNFNPSPKIYNLNGFILIGHPFNQTTVDLNSNIKKNNICTKFMFLKIQTKFFPNLDTAYELLDPVILEIINLPEKTIDNLSKLIVKQRVNFINQEIPNNFNLLEFNTILKTFFLNEEVAIDIALEKKFYSLALFLGPNNLKVRKSFLNYFLEDKKVFFDNSFELIDWRNNFELILRKNDLLILKRLINHLNNSETLILLLSFYYSHNLNIDCKYFYNNLYFLSLILKYNFKFINQDILIFRYLKISKEFGLDNSKYKKFISNKLINKLEEKSHWFLGIKKVFDKGLFRIAGVDEVGSNEFEIGEGVGPVNASTSVITDNTLNKGNVPTQTNLDTTDKATIIKDSLPTFKDKSKPIKDNIPIRKDNIPIRKDNIPIRKDNIPIRKDTIPIIKDSKLKKEESVVSKEPIPEIKVKETNASEIKVKETNASEIKVKDTVSETIKVKDTVSETIKGNSVYKNNSFSKTVNDVSDYQPIKEEKQSFFSKFNIFKKKSNKVELKGEDDFKYDPITKRWVSSIPTKTIQPIKKQEQNRIPLPNNNIKKTEFQFDDSLESRYAVKKEKGNDIQKDIKSFIPKPKQ